jgi:uncharacterized protein (DUF433 family)
MTTAMDGHVRIDEDGVARVGPTHLRVSHLVMQWRADGESWGAVQEAWPSVPPADLHAGLAYYHDHRDEIEREISEYVEFSDKMQAEQLSRPSVQRLLPARAQSR